MLLSTARAASARVSSSKIRIGAVLPQRQLGGSQVACTVRLLVAEVTSQIAKRCRRSAVAGARNCGTQSDNLWPLLYVQCAVRPEPLTHDFSKKSYWPTIRPSTRGYRGPPAK